eukprot:388845-Alexandrium_andersonii.AAC.1
MTGIAESMRARSSKFTQYGADAGSRTPLAHRSASRWRPAAFFHETGRLSCFAYVCVSKPCVVNIVGHAGDSPAAKATAVVAATMN